MNSYFRFNFKLFKNAYLINKYKKIFIDDKNDIAFVGF